MSSALLNLDSKLGTLIKEISDLNTNLLTLNSTFQEGKGLWETFRDVVIAGVGALVGALGERLFPLLKEAGARFTEFARGLLDMGKNAFGSLLPLLGQWISRLSSLATSSNVLTSALSSLGPAAAIAGTAFTGWKVGEFINQQIEMRQELEAMTGEEIRHQGVLQETIAKTRETALARLSEGEVLGNLDRLIRDHVLSLGQANEAAAAHGDAVELVQGKYELVSGALEDAESHLKGLQEATGTATDEVGESEASLSGYSESLAGATGQVDSLVKSLNPIQEVTGVSTESLKGLVGEVTSLSTFAETAAANTHGLVGEIALVGSGSKTASGLVKGLTDETATLGNKTDSTKKSLGFLKEILISVQDDASALSSRIGDLIGRYQDLSTAVDAVRGRIETESGALSTLSDRLSSAIDPTRQLASAQNDLANAIGRVNTAISTQQAFNPLITDTTFSERGASPVAERGARTPSGITSVLDFFSNLLSGPLPPTFNPLQFIPGYGFTQTGPASQIQYYLGNLFTELNKLPAEIEKRKAFLQGFIPKFSDLSGFIGKEIAAFRQTVNPQSIYSQIADSRTQLALAQANEDYQGIIDTVQNLVKLEQDKYKLEAGAVQDQIEQNRRLIESVRGTSSQIGETLLNLRFGSLAREIGGADVLTQTREARTRFESLVSQARGATGQNLVDIAGQIQSFAGTLLELGKVPAQQVPEFSNLFDEVFGSLQEVQSLVGAEQTAVGAETITLESQLSGLQNTFVETLEGLQNQASGYSDRLQESVDNMNDILKQIADSIGKLLPGGQTAQTAPLVDALQKLIDLIKNNPTTIQIDGKEIARVTRDQSRLGTPVVSTRGVGSRSKV